MYYVAYDNFLGSREFGALKQYLQEGFPWRLSGRINGNDENNEDMYLATSIYHAYNNGWENIVDREPFTFITSKLHIESIFRIKANFYFPSKSGKVEHHAKHADADFWHQGALFYVNTCDAPTTMADGTEIEAIENRLLLFDPVSLHSSSSPTNAPYRMTINFNYFGGGILHGHAIEMLSPIPKVSKNPHRLNEIFDISKSKDINE